MIAVINARRVVSTTMTELPRGAAGVFETVLWRDGCGVFWPEHWARFEAGCRWFDLQPDTDCAALLVLTNHLASENGISTGVVRYAAWRAADGSTHWQVETSPPRPHMSLTAFTVARGPALPPPDDARAFKHLARSPWLDALRNARTAGFDEVLLTNARGNAIEGGVSNVFFVRNAILHTPPASSGPLPGIVRAAVLELAGALRWDVREADVTVDELKSVEELWLTNSLIGVRPVRQLNEHVYPSARPKLAELCAAWRSVHGWDPAS